MFDRLARRIQDRGGWQRGLAGFLAGAVSALAMPPFGLFPLLFLTFPVLVWLLDGLARRAEGLVAAARLGWMFGFGYFLAGLWWVGSAFLVEADIFGWMLPFAIIALPAGLALFTAGGIALAHLLWSDGQHRIFALAFGLTAAEFARGHLLTGFPWNAFGYALAGPPILAQGAAVIGLWGLTLLAIIIFAAPAVLIAAADGRRPLTLPILAAGLLAVLAAYGGLRLASAELRMVPDLALRLVQPAIDQSQKWLPENRARIFHDYLRLTMGLSDNNREGLAGVDIVVWPESALPFVLDVEPAALPAIADMLPPETTLVAGMQRLERHDGDSRSFDVFNSVMVIDSDGTITASYDKMWLVPFGEFLPFQAGLESLGLRQLTNVVGGFAAGTRHHTLSAGSGPRFQPAICYEIIFPRALVRSADRPGWILNVTNDGWFGETPGPHQHLQQARLRAVEEGLPVVRAANTGISAVIDPYGRILQSLPLGVTGVIDSGLPRALPPTPFRRFGNGILAVMMLGALALALPGRRRR